MEIDKLLQDKRDEILRIAASHGARDVRVFGSLARGEARSDSDIDILVKLDPGRSLLDEEIESEIIAVSVHPLDERDVERKVRNGRWKA